MQTITLAVIAAFILVFGMISKRIQKTVITPPMMFVVFGLLLSQQALGLMDIDVEDPLIHILAELTLILVLFTDAARIDLSCLRKEHNMPIRLLSIGMPFTIILGAFLASLIFDYLMFWEAMVLGIILAPTDAALGQIVISSPRIPVRIRQALNVESGLNDGIALPILLFFLSLAGAQQIEAAGYWIKFAAKQIILGPVIGISVGYFGGKLVERAGRSDWITRAFQDLAALGLSLLAFALAEIFEGNGCIAAFAAGLTLGNTSRSICKCLYEFAEAEGQLLTLLTFMIFGVVMVMPALNHINWSIILYGILSLTVVRILPAAISLLGLGLQWESYLYLGWFGPRGIASILYALLVLGEVEINGREEMFTITMVTVLLSIFAHGLSALPASNWYADRTEKMKDEADMPEFVSVTEMPVRVSYDN